MLTDRAVNTGAASKASVTSVYVFSLILSTCSLLYELLIAQTLTVIAGNVVIWYSLTVGTYLAGMGIGALFCGSSKRFRGWSSLFRVEIMLSLIGASAVILLNLAHNAYIVFGTMHATKLMLMMVTVGFFGFSFILTLLIGILTGMELPLLIFLGNDLAENRNVTNRVLGWDYMGALVGGAVFPLGMVPFFQLHTIGFLVAGLNLIVALYILWRFLSYTPGVEWKIFASTAFGGALIIGCSNGHNIEQFFLKKYYYYNTLAEGRGGLFDSMSNTPTIFRESSPYQKIDIVHFQNNDDDDDDDDEDDDEDDLFDSYSTKFTLKTWMPKDYVLFLNGDFQFYSNNEELYHEWFAHVPIIINEKVPKRILILGGGDGLLHRELLKYNDVESITHVDIDRTLVVLAKTHPILTAVNEHAFDDPRVHSMFGDAFQYMRKYTGEPYDAIYMDFPNVLDYSLAKLYSREFFYFARKHLKDDGFIALDTPNVYHATSSLGDETLRMHRGDWLIHSNTTQLAGFKTVFPFYTILEVDNRMAYDRLVGLNAQERLDYLAEYSSGMEQAFMLLRKDERYGPFKYIDFGIELHILNEKRFKLSYPGLHKPMDQVDFSKVNSIFRPTLPNNLMWYIRTVGDNAPEE